MIYQHTPRRSRDDVWPLRRADGRTWAQPSPPATPTLIEALRIARIGAQDIPQLGARQHVLDTIDAALRSATL